MSEKTLQVAGDMVVGIAYDLHLGDDDTIDASDPGEPLEYIHGRGMIIPGLESALSGMQVGQSKQVVVEPADAYGEVDDTRLVVLPLDAFPSDVDLEIGLELYLTENNSNEQMMAFVHEIRDDEVVMDLNHPLAGQTLYFNVEVVSVRPATEEEISHGHVHGSEHVH